MLEASHRRVSVVATPLRAVLARLRFPRATARLTLLFRVGPAGARAKVHRDPELTACLLRSEQAPALTDVLADLPTSYRIVRGPDGPPLCRSEEHTSELQSRFDLVCRLLLEKKKL